MRTEPFTLEDLKFDLAELDPADLDAMAARIRWHLSTPYACVLKSVFGEALTSGLCLGVAHHGSGWIGERLIHPRFRSEVLEDELVHAMMRQLEVRGCATISVIVAPPQQARFERHGFSQVGAYVTYAGGQCEKPEMDEVELFEPHHSMGLFHLDKFASGEDRRELLSEHLYASHVFATKGRVQGFYVPLLGEGLIIADRPLAGLELLRWHLGHVKEVTVPSANKHAIEFLHDRGYTLLRGHVRMEHGERLSWKPEMEYAWIRSGMG